MPGIGIGISRFIKRASTGSRVTGLAMFSATSPFPTIYYNHDAGVKNPIDESPTYEVYATTHTADHAGEPITVHVPARLEIMTPDNVWHNADFAHILGDGTGANPSALLKCRIRNGIAVGTYAVNSMTVDHADLPPNYQVFNVSGVVKTAVHATTIAWQNALAVLKPSGKLLFFLDDLISGVDSDGDLTEMDYFHMVRGMETDEMRLKPLKTNSGSDADLIGSGASPNIFDSTGIKVTVNTQKTIRTKWKPITNGVKCTQNNNSMFVTFDGSTTAQQNYAGITGAGGVNFNLGKNSGGTMNSTRSWTSGFSPASVHTANAMFGVRRTSSSAFESWINGTTAAAGANTSAAISDVYVRFPGSANNSDTGDSTLPPTAGARLHCLGIGSNAINFTDVRARLNTYYTGLGLSTV